MTDTKPTTIETVEELELILARVFTKGQLNGNISNEIKQFRKILINFSIALLREVYELIGEDEKNKKPFETSQDMFVEVRNNLRAKQRKALETIIKKYK